MATASSMQEQVHEQAAERQQPHQYSEDMGAVLGQQQSAGDDKEAEQDQARSRSQKPLLGQVVITQHMHGLRLMVFAEQLSANDP
ncbi:hypothetical protein MesoLjLb_48300 [Mesorhizobium sp. L-8-3]|nr:hypothetical protein MesoLjLb_48300 [Mesorhizobium sp. L-8-3]